MDIILNVQWFKKPDNEFVVKGLAVIEIKRNERGYQEAGCILFNPSFEWDGFPAEYKIQNLWCERNYHCTP